MNNEELLLIKEHDWYYTPGDYLCESMLRRNKLSTGSVDLLKELARFYYYQMVQDPDYIKDEFKDIENLPDYIEAEEVIDRSKFYEELFPEYIPGYSPMEKAINTLKLIKKAKQEDDPDYKEEEDDSSESAKKQGDKKKGGKKRRLSTTLQSIKKNKPDKETFECQTWNKLLNKRGLDDFDNKLTYLNKVGIVEGFGKTFDIKKTVEEKRVYNSQKHKSMRLAEYSEIVKSPIYQRMFPNYLTKLLNKDLIVNTPIKTEESKQKIIILVDFSGSMNDRFKQEWVLSIVADRLYFAMKEECEIFFSFFIRDLYPSDKFVHIYDEKTALDFFKNFNTCPSGGDTYIGDVINKIKYEVETNKKLFNIDVDLSKDKPEILVINDGQDSCKVANFTWKTNAITLGDSNSELKKLSVQSGGRYLTISRNGKIGE